MTQATTLRKLLRCLSNAGYEWHPQTPDRLLNYRKNPGSFRPLVKCLGLGLPISKHELLTDGLTEELVNELHSENLIGDLGSEIKSNFAISGQGEIYVVHDHWPPDTKDAGEYVHFAAESATLARVVNRDIESFIGRRVLDLGCSSGGLMFELGVVASEVLGLDISKRAIDWGQVTAEALGYKNLRFAHVEIGSEEADKIAGDKKWDFAIANPPMVVPSKDAAYPHRDGGKLGIEIPLLFFDFAHRHLRERGELLTLATNPIVGGKPALFEKLDRRKWDVIDKRCLHTHFNQTVARKQGYGEQGIQNIELWFLHLRRL